jgi:SAM-dependent methyltransferase
VVHALTPVDVVSVLDLAAGTGSNLRYLAARLPRGQRWLLVDRDPSLLSQVRERTAASPVGRGRAVEPVPGGGVVLGGGLECHVETRCLDLDRLDDSGLFEGRHLVSASALLDLVSDHWLRTLAMRCRAAGAAALFTITYNGRFSCSPPEPEDEMVRRLMNEHQKRDKGLGGPAAGPDAADVAEQCFRDEGYVVQREPSDWVLDPGSDPGTLHEFHRELIDGWAAAASEVAPGLAPAIARWRARRFEHVAAGRSRLIVGHDDLAAWLPRGRADAR